MAGNMIDAKSIDTIRIEVLGEARSVTATGSQWVDWRDAARSEEVRTALAISLQCCEFHEGQRRRGWDLAFVGERIKEAMKKLGIEPEGA